MIITHCGDTPTIAEQFRLSWESLYVAVKDCICLESIEAEIGSETQPVLSIATQQEDLNPYEYARSAGILSFWDRSEENVYSLNDGEPV